METVSTIVVEAHKAQYDLKLDLETAFHTFNLIMNISKVFNKEALAYYKTVRASDTRFKEAQKIAMTELKKSVDVSDIIPSSSFTAKCNQLKDSDLDIYIYYKKMPDLSGLKQFGYTSKPSPNPAYLIYSKSINSIDIEIKIRNYAEGSLTRKLHHFLDKKLTTSERVAITYIKFNLVENKEAYKAFKYLVYNYCLYKMGEKKLF